MILKEMNLKDSLTADEVAKITKKVHRLPKKTSWK